VLIGVDASRAVIAQRTGTEVYSLHLIRALLGLDTDHRFRLYFNRVPAPGLFPDALHCEHRVIPFPRLWTHLRLSTEMLLAPPDVLFVPSHVLPLVHPRRSVVTVHDLGHRYYPEAHTAAQRWYLEWSTRYHVRTAAYILADSSCTRDDLVRIYGADPARVAVAHLGIDPGFRPVRDGELVEVVKRKYGLDGPYLLYIGTLQPRKNLVRLIEAFAHMGEMGEWANGKSQMANGQIGKWANGKWQTVDGTRNTEHGTRNTEHGTRNTQYATRNTQHREASRPKARDAIRDLRLVLAGKKGWLYDEILLRARELGIADRVVFPGFVDQADLSALYSGALLFVIPSLYEGFCMPALEAMACGTPVACSNVSSLPEVVGEAALTFDPHDVADIAAAVRQGVDDGALRADLIGRGFAQVKRFTWQRCAEQVLDVLERV
jgi:glycosyltransferase involved in cell wall biosynthesis